MSPLCESFLDASQLGSMEPFYPLHVRICEHCLLVQLPELVSPEEIFRDYAYFSSYSTSWVEHARVFVGVVSDRFQLGQKSLVVELASNDGYLLQHFVADGIPVLGVEPAANVARVARDKGVRTHVQFFGVDAAKGLISEYGQPDLLLGNNVLAHVPDINDFVGGMKVLLKPGATITMEFPHLMRLIDENQFDTIYHEHFCYLSFLVVEKIFARHGLTVFDVEELPTHGGSLRIYARHDEGDPRPVSARAGALRQRELARGYGTVEGYAGYQEKVEATKRKLLSFLIQAREAGKRVAGYGAPGKGNTLLNYCGIRSDLLDFTVDRSPHKQGMYLPGTHIPILAPEAIDRARPDYLLILPWNLTDEIVKQMGHVREWGCRFVVPIPEVQVID